MKTLITAALLLTAATPALAQETYRATGTEPFWSATIDARTIRVQQAGKPDVVVAKPRVIIGFAGEVYRTPRIKLNITHATCSDGMSDRVYRDTVTVTVDGRTLRGCGGEQPPVVQPGPGTGPAAAIDGEWAIQSVNGRPVAPRTSPDVTFSGGRISGDASCNRFSGSYRFARGRLTAGPLLSTRRACVIPGGNQQEAMILRLFEQQLSVSSNRGGKLVLTGRRGETIVLVRRGRR